MRPRLSAVGSRARCEEGADLTAEQEEKVGRREELEAPPGQNLTGHRRNRGDGRAEQKRSIQAAGRRGLGEAGSREGNLFHPIADNPRKRKNTEK